jgi:hypothetical protein
VNPELLIIFVLAIIFGCIHGTTNSGGGPYSSGIFDFLFNK